ncbi:hypothetical protein ABTN40_20585, partial [Acinetobacter baumannii]
SPWPASAGFAGRRGWLTVTGPDLAPATVQEAAFFPDEAGLLDNAAPQALTLRDGALTLALARPEGATSPLPGTLSGVL